jgi:hypothetical protein
LPPGGVTWLTILADPELSARCRNRFLLSHQGRSGSAEKTRMDIEDTDLVVIGMGPGGEDTAGRLAERRGRIPVRRDQHHRRRLKQDRPPPRSQNRT